ncbi:MAG: hypothetical protein H6Q17_2479 [Bacteroidetes bacterium]|nr:hypothetical protein [Bacteroidota bacterium]
MMKVLRHIAVIKIALLYCCLIAINGRATTRVSDDRNLFPGHAQTCVTAVPVDHQAYAGQAKLTGTQAGNLLQVSKNQVREQTLAARIVAGCYHHTLSCYLFYADSQIRRLEKPDIVFPFHTFW